MEKELKRYIRDIKRCLLCETKLSRTFINDLKQSIDQFVEAEPDADINAVKNHFGSPEEIARAFFAEADIGDVRKKIRFRRIVSGFLIAVLLLWGIAVGYSVVDSNLSAHGYGEENIVIFDPEEEPSTRLGEIIIQGDSA